MLYEGARHELLVERPWDGAKATQVIERIASGAVQSYDSNRLWALHPLDGEPANATKRMLYYGAAGVVWGLDFLHRRGAIGSMPDFAPILDKLITANHTDIADSSCGTAGLLIGDSGMLLLQWKLTRSAAVAARLAEVIESNHDNPVLELMWGAAGTMLAALTMYEWTGESSWRTLYERSEQCLWQGLENDAEFGCQIWTQHLYGSRAKLLGAVHGFAGNAYAVIRGRHLLPADRWERWLQCITQTMSVTTKREAGLVNWPPGIGPSRPGRDAILVQICHGAPGIIVCLAGLPTPDLDELLTAAGELTWQAGPLIKGSNLCHGTAGNAYAFLKLFRRTQSEMWLDRARAFAMHGIAQYEAELTRYSQQRQSLWTGDIGLAIFLHSCLQEDDLFPTMDVF